MKKKGILLSIFALCIIGAILIVVLIAAISNRPRFYNQQTNSVILKLANTIKIPCTNIGNIDISYSSDSVTFHKGETSELIIEEYMNQMDEAMFASSSTFNGTISIKGGRRNKGMRLSRSDTSISVYLPKTYEGSLQATVSSGNLRFADSFNLNQVDLKCSSGNINIKDITATNELNIQSSSGEIEAENLKAATLSLSANSGNISVDAITGNDISVNAKSGDIELEDASGNMTLEANSGDIDLKLLPSSSFTLDANTSSGDIESNFDDQLSFNKKRNSATGQVGTSPNHKIVMNASSGNISITK